MIFSISIITYNQNIISDTKKLGKTLNILSVFLWNISPMGAAPNGDLLYLNLPNWYVTVVRYDDFLSSFKSWCPWLASIGERYCTLLNFGSKSLSIGPLCTSFINAWFSLARSKHSLTFPFGFGTNTKLLHHSTAFPMPSGAVMSCYCRHSNSSLNDHCKAYAMCLGGAWYGLISI